MLSEERAKHLVLRNANEMLRSLWSLSMTGVGLLIYLLKGGKFLPLRVPPAGGMAILRMTGLGARVDYKCVCPKRRSVQLSFRGDRNKIRLIQ